ncbi:MAG: hypothetical protein K2Q22_17075, partial [Cytophagales bacterium]|nr:hypothetical protein [Cytophagales bacterium]
DKQTESVSTTYNNIKSLLLTSDSNLSGDSVFQNGSYDRDTIIKPLDDIDLFFVLQENSYKDEFGRLANPQSVLTKVKDYLNGTKDYKDKVKQDRPCVTIHLSDKKFDILPCFGNDNIGYLIPNYELNGWMNSNPIIHSNELTNVNKTCSGKVVPLVRIIKYWNREMNQKRIPSFHIEEMAINTFRYGTIDNFEDGVHKWFQYALNVLDVTKFDSTEKYSLAYNKLKEAKDKISKAHDFYKEGNELEAKKLYKEVFGDKFPTISEEEAKAMSENMKNGSLKMASSGILATGTINIKPTRFFGEENKD